jgi:hypothetical protein
MSVRKALRTTSVTKDRSGPRVDQVRDVPLDPLDRDVPEIPEYRHRGLRGTADRSPHLALMKPVAARIHRGLPTLTAIDQLFTDEELDQVLQRRAIAAPTYR